MGEFCLLELGLPGVRFLTGQSGFLANLDNCTKFVQLILSKIIKVVATSCQISRLKMHQIRFRLKLRPRPHWGSLQRFRRPLAGFKGPTSKEGKGGKRRLTCKGRKGKGGEEKERRRGRKERGGWGGEGKAGHGRERVSGFSSQPTWQP